MTLPALLPDWMPSWLQMLLWLVGVIIGLAWVVAPFIVIGMRSRLAYVSEQLDETQAQLRMVAQRMPEPISAARYEALRASLGEATGPAPSVSRGVPDDAAYRMPPRPVPEPTAYAPPQPTSPSQPMPAPQPQSQPHAVAPIHQQPPAMPWRPTPDVDRPAPAPVPSAFASGLPPRAPLGRTHTHEGYGEGADGYDDGDYARRLSSPFRAPRQDGASEVRHGHGGHGQDGYGIGRSEPPQHDARHDPRRDSRHEPRLRWPPRED